MQIAVKGGGHNYAASYLRDGGILLDVSRLRGIEIDRKNAIVRAQPGLRAEELCNLLGAEGLAFPAAHSGTVPIGGVLLGGGLGVNVEPWGQAACFNMLAVDAITASGERVTADTRTHPELLWAARGAGPAFCAVSTRFHLRAFPHSGPILKSSYAFTLP